MHSRVYDMEGDEEEVVDGVNSLPPSITQLGGTSQKRSSGRVTMPSSGLREYELY